MIVQLADYALQQKPEHQAEDVYEERLESGCVVDLSARRQSAAYKKAMAQILEDATKLDW